jgi:lipid-binding SYLF domain-containing protein
MRKALSLLLAGLLVSGPALAQKKNKDEERLKNCAEVLKEILDIPDNIPQELLDRAECVAIMPSVKKVALGFSGSYGKGALSCRTGENFSGPWSPPAMYRLEGGGFGLQLGGQATDFVLLVMNKKGADSLIKTKVKLGGDASAAAGPKGRTATAATDAYMRAEILTYSRNRGLFAGVSLEGSTLRQDNGANKTIYGREITARDIVRQQAVAATPAGQLMLSLLNKHSPKNLSD